MKIKDIINDIKLTIFYKRMYRVSQGFRIEKSRGSLFLTFYGIAFAEIDSLQTSEDIVALLDDAKTAALKLMLERRAGLSENVLFNLNKNNLKN